MKTFNDGKPYHGSDAVTGGKLRGATDKTDYFYFFCPKCSGDRLLRVLDYEVRAELSEHPYKDHVDVQAPRGFVLAFQVHCDHCLFQDFVKVGNTGWQGGTHSQALEM
jgi:hypothetical protein